MPNYCLIVNVPTLKTLLFYVKKISIFTSKNHKSNFYYLSTTIQKINLYESIN